MPKTIYFLPDKIEIDEAFELYAQLEKIGNSGSLSVLNNQRELIKDNSRNDILKVLKTIPRHTVLVLWDLTQIKDFEKFYYALIDRRMDQLQVRVLNPNYTLIPSEPDCKALFEGFILLQKTSFSFPTVNNGLMPKGMFGRIAIPEEKIKLMIKDRLKGASYEKIADLYGVSRSTAQKYLKGIKAEKKIEVVKTGDNKPSRFPYDSLDIGVDVPSEIHSIYKMFLRTRNEDSTRKVYLNDFRKLIAFLNAQKDMKPKRVRDLTENLLFDYFDYLDRKEYKNSYIRRILAGFRAFFNYAMKKGVIKSNPAIDIPMPPSENYEVLTDPLSKDEMDKIIEVAKWDYSTAKTEYKKMLAHRNLVLIYVLVSVGMRGGAILNLKVKDFTFERDIPKIKLKGKGIESYKVSMDRKTAYLLDSFIQKYLNNPNNEEEYIFFAKDLNRKSISHTALNMIIKKIAKKAGHKNYEDVRGHSFRVTFATMQDGRMTSKELQKRMGHADIRMTEAYKRIGLKKIENDWLPVIEDNFLDEVMKNA